VILLSSNTPALEAHSKGFAIELCYTVDVKQRAIFLLASTLAILNPVELTQAAITPQVAAAARALEARYHEAKTLEAIFLERYSDSRQALQAESGKVYFSRPGRMRWEYEAPEQKLFISDGKTVWFYVPSDHTVTRAPIKESTDWRTPLALLTGKAKLSQLCQSLDLSEEIAGKQGNIVLRCRPRGEKPKAKGSPADHAEGSIAPVDQPFDEVLLEVNPDGGELADVRVLQPGGIEVEYRFGNWQRDLPLAESLFHFHAPPGVAIVEQPK
jgi:outer membrane lipoprotein carrier protein